MSFANVSLWILAVALISLLFLYPLSIISDKPELAVAIMATAALHICASAMQALRDGELAERWGKISSGAQMLYVGMLLGSISGCAATPSINPDALLDSVALEGDLRCEGEGTLHLLGFLAVQAEGLASTDGGTVGTDTHGGACAGVAITLGPWRWVWVSETDNDTGECAPLRGSLTVEPAQ